MMKRRDALAAIGAIAACGGVTGPSQAQQSDTGKPIQMVTALSNSGVSDLLARSYSERLSQSLQRPCVVVNKPGAGGIVAAQTVAASPSDGSTLLLTNSAHTINQLVHASLPYDPLADFLGIAKVANAPAVICVSDTLGVKTLQDFIELARRQPGTINFSSAGPGTTTHLAGAYFSAVADVRLVHIPYKNISDAVADLISGRVAVAFPPASFAAPLMKQGRVLALGVASRDDIEVPLRAPSVPRMGIAWEYGTWYGFLTRSKTPRPVVDSFIAALTEAGNGPELRRSLELQGISPEMVTGARFDEFMRAEVERLRLLMRTTGIQLAG